MGSSLDFLKPAIRLLPEVKSPASPRPINERLLWTGIALLIFFVMYNIVAVGVNPQLRNIDFLQVVTASRIGTLVTTGIGPIVLASIFLQLFNGAKIINVDLSDPEQRGTFHGAQKLLGILLAFFEAAVFVLATQGLLIPGAGVMVKALVIFQIAVGSIILLYLDEVVSKYGIGSGISLFIAAGVSLSIVGGIVTMFAGPNGVISIVREGGATALPNALLAMLPLFFTMLIFLIVVYAEGMRVEIPLAFERARGVGGRFPIKFLYVSNIPVILASALLLNVQFFSSVIPPKTAQDGGVSWIDYLGVVGPNGRAYDGLLYLITPIFRSQGIVEEIILRGGELGSTPLLGIPEYAHIIFYILFLVLLCVVFGMFWVETAGMGPKDVAEQLNKSGLQIPGYRRDPRVVEKVLERYIPTITILGSIFVGLLAGIADLTGALGTGTGILLTVGIVHKLYEDLESQKLFALHPGITSMLGE